MDAMPKDTRSLSEAYVESLVYCPDTNKGSCAGMSFPEGPEYDGCIDTGNIDPEPGDEIEREAQIECGTMWGSENSDGEVTGSVDCDCGPWKAISIMLIVIIVLAMLGGAFLYWRKRKKTSPAPARVLVQVPATAQVPVQASPHKAV